MKQNVRMNTSIQESHYPLLCDMLNDAWGFLVEATPDVMRSRAFSTNPIFTYNAVKQESDGVKGLEGFIPVVLLETVLLKTDGEFEAVPDHYDKLTSGGMWQDQAADYDTLIMVDATALRSRRGGDITQNFLRWFVYTLGSSENEFGLFDNREIEHVWTYTPDIDKVKGWHESMGATDTGYKKPGARFRHTTPKDPQMMDVNFMSYKGAGYEPRT